LRPSPVRNLTHHRARLGQDCDHAATIRVIRPTYRLNDWGAAWGRAYPRDRRIRAARRAGSGCGWAPTEPHNVGRWVSRRGTLVRNVGTNRDVCAQNPGRAEGRLPSSAIRTVRTRFFCFFLFLADALASPSGGRGGGGGRLTDRPAILIAQSTCLPPLRSTRFILQLTTAIPVGRAGRTRASVYIAEDSPVRKSGLLLRGPGRAFRRVS